MRPIDLEVAYLTAGDAITDVTEGEVDNDTEVEEDGPVTQTPMTALKIDSKDSVEMTLTKTSLGLLQSLGQVSHDL